jgi:flap endonuclease-1
VDPEEVFNLFLDPPYAPVDKPKWKMADPDAVMKILVGQHDFSEERVKGTLDTLLKMTAERAAQSKLDDWL